MQFNKKDIYEIEIEKPAYGGQGIGSIKTEDGDYRVFVAGSVPGDVVSVKLKKIKKNFAEAQLVKIIKPSELRIEAKCKHFDICGGCTWQNLKYEMQLKFKKQIVSENIEHLGGLKDVDVRPIIKCANEFYYRNKMEFSFGDNKDEDFVLGFHPPKMRFDVFMVKECFLQDEKTIIIIEKIYNFFRERNIPRYNFRKNEGVLRTVFVRKSETENKFLINLVINESQTDWENDFINCLKSIDGVSGIFISAIKTKKGRRTERTIKKLWGESTLNETLNLEGGCKNSCKNRISLNFQIDPDSFFQTNTRQAEILYNQVLKGIEEIDFSGGNKNDEDNDYDGNKITAFDMYCGTGTISLILANRSKKVYGFEINSAATNDAVKNAKLNNIDNVDFVTGDVLKTVPEIKDKPDLIVIDPPRAGVADKTIQHLVSLGAKGIIYVSCNPATLARDLKIFSEAGYKVLYVQPVDMFPQTYHIECVAVMEKE